MLSKSVKSETASRANSTDTEQEKSKARRGKYIKDNWRLSPAAVADAASRSTEERGKRRRPKKE